ncbi:MAG: 50S ribosomal protein L24 [Acidobacteriota bacterium]|nr:50S ribosomal protein L24 [Acidobacteriota bacterium]MDW3229209.1 50S ribosomal protein L24 [Acidobacteriota bacterium]MDY0231243.1 50S ribosomal protein L24 [Candidatus Saccharicenans sp.]
MANLPFKKNDIVMVRRGKDRGKTGKVLKVIPEKNRVLVEKINMVKVFIRPDRSQNIQGGIMEKEAPIHISNLSLYCEQCERGVRFRNKVLEDGTKTRVCINCQTNLEKS